MFTDEVYVLKIYSPCDVSREVKDKGDQMKHIMSEITDFSVRVRTLLETFGIN